MTALRSPTPPSDRVARGFGVWSPIALLAAVIATGTLGYIIIEGWSAWDAFYMTVTTVATVGYREVNPLSASRDDTLRRAQIDKARGLVAAVGTDAENVYSVLTARVLKPELFVIARAESEDSIAKLKRAGADRVISPYQIGA